MRTNLSPDYPPANMKLMMARAGRRGVEIAVFGHRDPRGPDNNIYIWVDEHDQLHIRVQKTSRCYRHKKVISKAGYIETLQV
jgi:hypothetical protein